MLASLKYRPFFTTVLSPWALVRTRKHVQFIMVSLRASTLFFNLESPDLSSFHRLCPNSCFQKAASPKARNRTKHIWPKARNRLGIEKLKNLKHRFSALRLKEGTLSSDAVDPEEEMIKYWEPEDFVDPYVAPNTAAATTTATTAPLNLVNAWLEDLEKGLLTTDEKKDATARFRLLNKTRGLHLRDVDPTYDEYRVVSFCYPFACCLLNSCFFSSFLFFTQQLSYLLLYLPAQVAGLEWSKQKSRDPNYGNKKGWMAVCELMPGHCDLEIADADGDKSEIRELYATNDKFYELVLAAPEGDQKRNLIRPDQPSSDEEADGP